MPLRKESVPCHSHLYDSLHLAPPYDGRPFVPPSSVAIQKTHKHFCFDTWSDDNLYKHILAFWGWGLGGDSRVSQEQQVEHRVVLAEVDQRPAEHPATHGQQAEPSCDQKHVSEQWSAAALRHLHKTDGRTIHSYQKDCCTNTALSEVWFPQGCVLKCVSCLYTQVCVFTSETIVQTSLLANMTVMKIARW